MDIMGGSTYDKGYGGYSVANNTSNNTVDVHHVEDTAIGTVYGGFIEKGNGTHSNNVIKLNGEGTINNVILGHGGSAINGGEVSYFSGKIGTIKASDTKGIKIQNTKFNLGAKNEAITMNSLSINEIGGFNEYNFYLPKLKNLENGAVALSTKQASLGDAQVNAYLSGEANVQEEASKTIHLIKSDAAIDWDGRKWSVYEGVSSKIDFANIALDGKNLNLSFTGTNPNATPAVKKPKVWNINSDTTYTTDVNAKNQTIANGLLSVEATKNATVNMQGADYKGLNLTGNNSSTLNWLKGNNLGDINNFQTLNFGATDGKKISSTTALNLNAKSVSNIGTLNFYLPEFKHDQTVLKVQSANLDKTKVNAYLSGDVKQEETAKVLHLISSASKIEGTLAETKVHRGITETLDFGKIDLADKNLDLTLAAKPATPAENKPTENPAPAENTKPSTPAENNNPSAPAENQQANNEAQNPAAENNTAPEDTTATENTPVTVATKAPAPVVRRIINPQTKSLLQGRLATAALVNSSSEDYAGSLNELYSTTGINSNINNGSGFVQIAGENSKIKTGSHIDLKAVNLKLGYAHNFVNSSGTTLAGGFAEYGNGDYDAYLDDSTKGEGNVKYYGLGLMANHSFNNGFYVQGSLKGGKTEQDYSSNDFDFTKVSGININYEGDASYVATHAGLGLVSNLGESDKLDTYAKYLFSRSSGDDIKISSGETYHFDAVKSSRLRVGSRYEHLVDNLALYGGLAYEHEFDGKANANWKGHRLPSPTMKGGTGILELGVTSRGEVQFDAGIKGYTGRRKGAGLKFGVRF